LSKSALTTSRLALLALIIAAAPAGAQDRPTPCFASSCPTLQRAQSLPEPTEFRNVISANPLGLLLDLFNAEYERVRTSTTTMGIGGSTFLREDAGADRRYYNLDVFYRFYPSSTPYEGWNFGVKVGITSVAGTVETFLGEEWYRADGGTFFGYGFDVNRSWLLGPRKNFYVGSGFGLKKLVGAEDAIVQYHPTWRIINVGRAF
jgi:hypothetical protein